MSCPSCGAAVRAGDPWCTLCWADLRPPPPVPAAAPVDPLTAPMELLAPPAVAPAPAAYAAPPVSAAPAPMAAPVAASHWATPPGAAPFDPLTAPLAAVDPLTAPLAAVLGGPLAADPEAPSVPTWPCVECGGRSPLEVMACTTCGTPFGGRISRLDDAKAVRQRRMVMGIGAAAAFLALLAALTFATTPKPPAPETSVEIVSPE